MVKFTPFNVQADLSNYEELRVVDMTPVIQVNSHYNNLNEQSVEQFTTGGSTITEDDGVVTMTNSTGVGDFASILSYRNCYYKSGQGTLSRFNCLFDSGAVANSLQLAGLGTGFNGAFFGYNGTQFGVMHRYGGQPEIRKITITSAFSASATIVITLNDVPYNVDVVDAGGNLSFSAHQIEEGTTYTGWNIEHVNDEVFFVSTTPGLKNGTYSVDFSTSGGAGTFSQVTAGVDNTENWYYQADWNYDTMDGFGESRMTLNQNTFNMYQISFKQAGLLKFYIEHFQTGDFVLVHTINFNNVGGRVVFSNPNLRMLYAVASLGSTTSLSIKMSEFSCFVNGILRSLDPSFAISNTKIVMSPVTVLTIKNTITFNGLINHSNVVLRFLSVATDGTKSVIVRLIRNALLNGNTITDYDNYQYENEQNSSVIYDTDNESYTGGNVLFSFVLAKIDTLVVDLSRFEIDLTRGDTISIVAESTANNEVSASLSWVEDT